jgi:glycosyltransferase involved in cell wall biosynthesis
VRLAIVAQRYGNEISGGAELHARLVGEMLAEHHDITILTTCATDYVSWANEYPAGIDTVNGIPTYRFPVRKPRDPKHFGRLQQRVFHRDHDDRDAEAWMDAQGPYSPRMRDWIGMYRDEFDYFICFSYRYWTTYHALQQVQGKGILVPTAEPDPSIEMPMFRPMFRSARAIMYNSVEEHRMIVKHADNERVPGVVVGVGIIEPPPVDPEGFRRRNELDDPFLLYVGRIDANKGCAQLFDYYCRAWERLRAEGERVPRLVLAGSAVLEIPEHPAITYLGRVSEQEKYDALAAATALVMPSFYESLSMVLLEAWALRRPVLVNAHCDVLEGQVRRSGGGLWYRDLAEFTECLRVLSRDPRLGDGLGEAGNRYYESHYTWPVIDSKYEAVLQQLAAEDGR